jgi:FkbM family methyltransferase
MIESKMIKERTYVKQQLEILKGKKIFLYGAGSFGKEICTYLEQQHIPIEGFLDRNAAQIKTYCGHPVFRAEEKAKEDVTVLFAIVMDKTERQKIIDGLYRLGYGDVQEAQYYRSMQIVPDDDPAEDMTAYYKQNEEKIKKAYAKLADEKSRKIYEANLAAHFTRDYSQCAKWEDAMEEQYFPTDLTLHKGYHRFVDCGAFVGDTLWALLEKKGGKVTAVAEFEPDIGNFSKLSRVTAELSIESCCYPCAVSDRTQFQSFRSACGSGTMTEEGDTTVLSVSLDETIHGFHPTFLKMDIEGAEKRALDGARKIIAADTPDLAVCVYHNINHLWDILLQIDAWDLGYQFYLRSYNAYTMETVLYATKQG